MRWIVTLLALLFAVVSCRLIFPPSPAPWRPSTGPARVSGSLTVHGPVLELNGGEFYAPLEFPSAIGVFDGRHNQPFRHYHQSNLVLVEEKALALGCRRITSALVRELVCNEMLAMRQAESALAEQAGEERYTSEDGAQVPPAGEAKRSSDVVVVAAESSGF